VNNLNPREKRGGYYGSKPKGPIKVPTSQGANVTQKPVAKSSTPKKP
jgi:hypothetical protein